MRIRRIFALLAILLPLTGLAQKMRFAEKFGNDSSVFTLSVDQKQKIEQGKTFEARIKVHQTEHWHMYSSKSSEDGPTPLSIVIHPENTNNFSISSIRELGKVTQKFDSEFKTITKFYKGNFEIVVKVNVKKNALLGKTPFSLAINYVTCSESTCLPPRNFAIPMIWLGQKPLEVTIAEASDTSGMDTADVAAAIPVDTVLAPPPMAAQSNDTIAEAAKEKDISTVPIAELIILSILGGLAALVTPCVFPMIPITVSFFTKRNQESRKDAIRDATLYAFGIIFTFVALGLLLSLVAGPAGIRNFASNPWTNMVVAAIFIAFALNLFGMFEIGLPSSVVSKLNMQAMQHKNKVMSVIMMGFVFSLTSFTCTVPIVSNLSIAFSRGDWVTPLIGMSIFATVFALPFFLLALFPKAMKSLPKSGGWLNSVKVVMGFLEIAFALKFISNIDLVWKWDIFTRDLVLASWAATAIIIALYLLGRFNLPHDTPSAHIGPLRAVFAVVFLTAGIYLFTGFGGKHLGELDALLPPAEEQPFLAAGVSPLPGAGGQTSVRPENQQWHPRLSTALAEAKASRKNVFVDFTGYTCTNCRAMESQVFSRREVKGLFEDFVLARLYTDDGTPLNDSNQSIQEIRFNTIALPYYVVLSPDDQPLGTFPGYTRDVQSFISFLLKNRSNITKDVAEVK
jgi:thiol:disulfide interchange protein